MARNGKKRLSAEPSQECLQARRRKIESLKQAVNDGSYSIHTEDLVLNVLREVMRC